MLSSQLLQCLLLGKTLNTIILLLLPSLVTKLKHDNKLLSLISLIVSCNAHLCLLKAKELLLVSLDKLNTTLIRNLIESSADLFTGLFWT